MERAVEKVVKLDSSCQVLLFIWKIAWFTLARTFQLHQFSNCTFQLHINQTVTVYCCYLCLWWLFGHLSNDYELSAIKIRAEIYFRVKIQFRHFWSHRKIHNRNFVRKINEIVFRKVTNLISKCPDDSIYILFFYPCPFLCVIISQTKDENPTICGWYVYPSTSALTWFLINKSEMTKAKIIWPYNVSHISNQSRKNQMRLISDRFENFLWSRRT